MEKLHFAIHINAPKEKVWSALWEDASYRNWTSAFMEGSHAITDNWKQGTKVLFLDPERNGMVSVVAENRPNEYMSFLHQGEVREGVEDTHSEQVKQWQGSSENYTLTPAEDGTDLNVEMQGNISAGFKDYFQKVWPVALEKLKSLAEKN